MEDFTKMIETERLILRKFEMSDANDMFENYCKFEEVARYVCWKAHEDVECTKKYLANVVLPEYRNNFTYRWAIVLKEINQVIGCIDVVKKDMNAKSAEIGYVLGKNFWGQGIMPEAGKAVISYLFEQGFVRIWAVHDIENPKSGRVMQKLGMQKEGTLRRYALRCDGHLSDCDIYSIIKEGY